MTIRSLSPACAVALLGIVLTTGILVRQGMHAQVDGGISCTAICSGLPPEEQNLCMDACNSSFNGMGDTAASSAGTSSSVNLHPLHTDPSSTLPGWTPAVDQASSQAMLGTCTTTAFRRQETGFCILASSCSESTLQHRGFVRDVSCRNSLDLTHLYRAPGEHAAAPVQNDEQFTASEAASQAILIVDPLLNHIPQFTALAATVQEFRSYLSVLHSNASMRTLTALETEATLQYLRLRLLDIAEMLRKAGISIDDQAQVQANKRQSIEDGLRTILYSLLPRLFEKVALSNVPGLDLSAARSIHGSAAEQFEIAKTACAQNRMSADCTQHLQTVLDTLLTLKTFLQPKLEATPLWIEAETTLTLEQSIHAAHSEEGFPRPVLQ